MPNYGISAPALHTVIEFNLGIFSQITIRVYKRIYTLTNAYKQQSQVILLTWPIPLKLNGINPKSGPYDPWSLPSQ